MFKPELWQSHDEYRTLVTTVGRRLSRNNPKYSFDLYKEERDKLLNLDLDPLLELIPTYYPDGGRPAQHQAQILRSLVLFVLLFNKTKRGKFVSGGTAGKDGEGNGCGKDFPDPGSKACAGLGFIKEQDKKYQ